MSYSYHCEFYLCIVCISCIKTKNRERDGRKLHLCTSLSIQLQLASNRFFLFRFLGVSVFFFFPGGKNSKVFCNLRFYNIMRSVFIGAQDSFLVFTLFRSLFPHHFMCTLQLRSNAAISNGTKQN